MAAAAAADLTQTLDIRVAFVNKSRLAGPNFTMMEGGLMHKRTQQQSRRSGIANSFQVALLSTLARLNLVSICAAWIQHKVWRLNFALDLWAVVY